MNDTRRLMGMMHADHYDCILILVCAQDVGRLTCMMLADDQCAWLAAWGDDYTFDAHRALLWNYTVLSQHELSPCT